MPVISTQTRAQIGGNSEQPTSQRATVKASTGMNMPAKAPVETKQPGTVAEPTAREVTLSPQQTALSRKQQKLQQEIQAQREKEAAFQAKQADYIPKSSIQAKLQQSVDEALMEATGMNYEQIAALKLQQLNGIDPVNELRGEIDKLKQSQEEQVNKQYDATIKQYRAETDAVVAADPKSFHFLAKGKKSQEWGDDCPVVTHIVETWEENPDKVLTVKQAAQEIEEFLREDAKAKAAVLAELNTPEETATPGKKTLPAPGQRPAARTLSSQVETTPTRSQGQLQHMSMRERIAEATRRAQR